MKISIPTPCHEDWDKMTPKEKGSFCDTCAKVVVDFTKLTKTQIKQYFLDEKEEKTCGRFTSNQLNVDLSLPKSNRSYLSKFAFALYLVFGTTLFSCVGDSSFVQGEIDPTQHVIHDSVKADTITYDDVEIGEVEAYLLGGAAVVDSGADLKQECMKKMGVLLLEK